MPPPKAAEEVRREAEASAALAIVEDAWMVCRKDGRKGRVVKAGKAFGRQLFQLRDQSGSLGSKRYGALDLQPDAIDVIREQKVAVPAEMLVGSTAQMWWRDGDEDGAGAFYPGVLTESLRAPGEPGACLLHYNDCASQEDDLNDELVVFVQPDGGCVVHRADGGEHILDDEIQLDEKVIAAAVAAVFPAASSCDNCCAAAGNAAASSLARLEDQLELSPEELNMLSAEQLRRRYSKLHASLLATKRKLAQLGGGEASTHEVDADGESAGEEERGEDGGVNGPVPESWRWYVMRALLSGLTDRNEIVVHVLEERGRSGPKNPRDAAQGAIRHEKRQRQPLWRLQGLESATMCSLTAEGESLRGTGGYEDLEQDEQAAAPKEGSLRADVLTALHAGCASRDSIVSYTWEHGQANVRGSEDLVVWRSDVTTVLGKEKRHKNRLWLQHDTTYSLTPMGQKLSGNAESSQSQGSCPTIAPVNLQSARNARQVDSAPPSSSTEQNVPAVAMHEQPVMKREVVASEAMAPLATPEAAVPEVVVVESIDEPLVGATRLKVGHLGRVVVDWMRDPSKGRYRGVVTEWRTELGQKGTVETLYRVAYDDTQQCEHSLSDPKRRAWVESVTESEEAQLGWQRYEFACQISKRRLVTPARGSRCTHPALCNEMELRGYVGRTKQCPIMNYAAPLERVAAIVIDKALLEKLARLPSDAQTFWYGPCGEVTHDQPSVSKPPRKRNRTEINLDAHSA